MKLQRSVLSVAVVLTLVLVAGSAFAQERGEGRRGGGRGGFGGFGGRGMDSKTALLGFEQVIGELKATDEQKTKIGEILASYRESARELRGGRGRDQSQEEREAAQAKREELTKKTDEKLVAVLKDEQKKRLDEIVVQRQGIDALVTENVVAALKLEEEKVAKIRTAIEKRDQERQALFPRGRRGGGGDRPDFEELRTKTEKINTDADKAVMALLSEEQVAAFTKLKGETFELDLRRGGGAFRGGRGGAGRDGDGQGGRRRRPDADDGDV
jgi:Spy/CpxP family protein refolding chaperone